MCKKIDFRIECSEHGYPYSEALFPDKAIPIPCNESDEYYEKYIEQYTNKVVDLTRHIKKLKRANRERISQLIIDYSQKNPW